MIQVGDEVYEYAGRPGHQIRYWADAAFRTVFGNAFTSLTLTDAVEAEAISHPVPCHLTVMLARKRGKWPTASERAFSDCTAARSTVGCSRGEARIMNSALPPEPGELRPRGANGNPLSPEDAIVKCRRIALVCALGVVGVSLLALLGRWTERYVLAGAFRPDWNPMATDTALTFLLLGSMLWWWVGRPDSPLARWGTAASALLVVLWGVFGLLRCGGWLSVDLQEQLLPRSESAPDKNIMSPLTAGNCCLGGLAFLLQVWAPGWLTRRVASVLTALVALRPLWVLFCYVEVDRHTLRDGLGIPVAVPTAIAWLFFGVGLILAEGPGHFLIQPLLGSSTRSLLFRSFLPATVGVMLVAGVLRGSLASQFVDLALLSTLWTLSASLIVSFLILYVANRIGRKIDRAERDRDHAEHAMEEMRKAREAAEQHNRIKSQFLANMSHELRTPLTVILGYVELLREQVREEGQEQLLPDLEEVHTQGKHLLTLINDLLDMSKIEADKVALYPETFDLAGMVRDVAAVVRPLVEKNANTFEMRLGESEGPTLQVPGKSRRRDENDNRGRSGDDAHRRDSAASVPAEPAEQRLQVHGEGRYPPGGEPHRRRR